MKMPIDYWKKLSNDEKKFLRDFENCALPQQTEEEKKADRLTRDRILRDFDRQICIDSSPEPALLNRPSKDRPPSIDDGELSSSSSYYPPSHSIEDLIIEVLDGAKKKKKRRNRQKIGKQIRPSNVNEG